jgi:hypothetical protein
MGGVVTESLDAARRRLTDEALTIAGRSDGMASVRLDGGDFIGVGNVNLRERVDSALTAYARLAVEVERERLREGLSSMAIDSKGRLGLYSLEEVLALLTPEKER